MQVDDIVPFNASWRDQSTQRTFSYACAVAYRGFSRTWLVHARCRSSIALTFLAVYYLLSFFVLVRVCGFKRVRMVKVKSVSEVEVVDACVEYLWSVLRRMEEGWIESDQENWEEAIRIFEIEIRRLEGAELLGVGRAEK